MRAAVKNKRAADKAAEWLKAQGVSEDVIAVAKTTVTKSRDELSQEAEGVLAYLEKPTRFVIYNCKRCGESFGTNYKYNKYCTDNCRSKALKALGLEWDPTADSKSRWGGEPPLTLPAESIQTLLAAAEYVRASLSAQTPSQEVPNQSRNEPLSEPESEYSPESSRTGSQDSTAGLDRPSTRTSETHTSLDFSLPELDDF